MTTESYLETVRYGSAGHTLIVLKSAEAYFRLVRIIAFIKDRASGTTHAARRSGYLYRRARRVFPGYTGLSRHREQKCLRPDRNPPAQREGTTSLAFKQYRTGSSYSKDLGRKPGREMSQNRAKCAY